MLKRDFEALRPGDLVSIRDTSGRYRVARVAGIAHTSNLYKDQLYRIFEYIDTGKEVYKRMRQVRGKLEDPVKAEWDMGNEWGQIRPDGIGWF